MKHTTHAWLAALLCAGGCEQVKRIDQGDTGGECVLPDQVQAIFDQSCALAGCHGMGAAQQNLSLEAGQSEGIVGRASSQVPSLSLVEIGNVSGSYLAIKIQPDVSEDAMLVGDVMPVEPGELSENDRAVLLGWIAGAELPCAGGGTGTTTGAADTGTGDTGVTLQACGIQDLKAGAPDPIDAGTGAGQIPPDIADVLANNCGCHYADELDVTTVADYPSTLPLDITTIDGFNALLPPDDTVTYMKVLERVTSETLPMPPAQCQLEGGVSITQADEDLLVSWLEAGAPDGATWMP